MSLSRSSLSVHSLEVFVLVEGPHVLQEEVGVEGVEVVGGIVGPGGVG